MNDFQRFEKALQAAADAGDIDAAGALAAEMRRMMQQQNPSLGLPEDRGAEASRMAAEGVGPVEAARIAAGRGIDKLISGAKQVAHLARTTPPPFGGGAYQVPPDRQAESRQALESLAQQEAVKNVEMSGLQQARPFSTAVGDASPAIVASAAPSLGILNSALMSGAVEASKYGTGGERLGRGILSTGTSMAGGLLGNAVGRAIAPVADDALSQTQKAALDSMDNMGVRPRLSQVTNSPFWARVEDWASRTPGGAGVMRQFTDQNARAVNSVAARAIGENADELTPGVFSQASQRLGKVFEDVKALGGKPIQINKNVADAADDILRQQGKMLPTQQDAALVSLANQAKALAANKGRIDGESYQLIRSGLSEASYDATGSNRVLYGKLLSALDDSAEASLNAAGKSDLAAALRSARPQYANLKTLERGAVAEGGDVSPARLASVMRTQNPAAFREGKMAGNPLYDIAKMGETFKPLQAGSPTYERTLLGDGPISTLLRAGPAYAGAKLTTSPAALFYPRNIGNTAAAGLLAQGVNPAVRAGTMGILNTAAGPMLFPVMAEQ